jgi:serine/threonine protein kinase
VATVTESSGDESIVVVKFTPSYSKEAHSMLAALKLAPRLWFCERVQDAGGLYVVVMDYMDSVGYSRQNSKASRCLRQAIKHLHCNGYVFGDLRDPNVLVTQDGSAMLVDFDWCGKRGEARYPLDINLNKEEICKG